MSTKTADRDRLVYDLVRVGKLQSIRCLVGSWGNCTVSAAGKVDLWGSELDRDEAEEMAGRSVMSMGSPGSRDFVMPVADPGRVMQGEVIEIVASAVDLTWCNQRIDQHDVAGEMLVPVDVGAARVGKPVFWSGELAAVDRLG